MKKLLFIFILLVLIIRAGGATDKLLVYTLTSKNGLADNVVNCFFQDSRGLMWMGTNYGLNVYDGSVMNTYRNSAHPFLPHDCIYELKEDSKQRLWIATAAGLCCYDLRTDSFASYKMQGSTDASNRMLSLALLDDHAFIASSEGLVVFDMVHRSFKRYTNAGGPGSNNVTKIFIDRRRQIWLGTYNGLWKFDYPSAQFTAYDTPGNDPLFDGLITDIFEDHARHLWFGTWSKGLKQLIPETRTVPDVSGLERQPYPM